MAYLFLFKSNAHFFQLVFCLWYVFAYARDTHTPTHAQACTQRKRNAHVQTCASTKCSRMLIRTLFNNSFLAGQLGAASLHLTISQLINPLLQLGLCTHNHYLINSTFISARGRWASRWFRGRTRWCFMTGTAWPLCLNTCSLQLVCISRYDDGVYVCCANACDRMISVFVHLFPPIGIHQLMWSKHHLIGVEQG